MISQGILEEQYQRMNAFTQIGTCAPITLLFLLSFVVLGNNPIDGYKPMFPEHARWSYVHRGSHQCHQTLFYGNLIAHVDVQLSNPGEFWVRVWIDCLFGVSIEHLSADEHEDRGQAVAQVVEHLHQAGKGEEQSSKAEDRKHVRAEHDERV